MGENWLKCYGCENVSLFTSLEKLEKHQKKTGHENDQESIYKWQQKGSKN